MKNIAPYLPFAIIAAAVVLGVYFFYYKPKKDATDAANAEAQKAYDATLTAYASSGKTFQTSVPVTGSILATKSPKANSALLAKLLK